MFVAAPFRGPQHGVGQRPLEELLRWSAARGMRRIYLGTTRGFPRRAPLLREEWLPPGNEPAAFPVMKVDSRFYGRALRA